MRNNIQIAEPPAATPSPGEIIDEKELLRRLPISRRTLFNMRERGRIPFVKLPRRVLFCWSDVVEALRRQTMRRAS